MAKQIPLSFKDNDEENEIYNFLKSKSSPSAFVKDLIRGYMNSIEIKISDKASNKTSDKESGLSSLKSLVK